MDFSNVKALVEVGVDVAWGGQHLGQLKCLRAAGILIVCRVILGRWSPQNGQLRLAANTAGQAAIILQDL